MTGAAPDSTHHARALAVLERLQNVSSPEDGVAAVDEILSQLLGSEEYALLALDGARGRLSLVASRGAIPDGLEHRTLATGLIGRVVRRGAAFVAGRSSRLGASADEASLSACVPLTLDNRVAGVLAIFRLLPHKRKLVPGDVELLDILATHAAVALKSTGRGATHLVVEPSTSAASFVTPDASRIKTVYLYPGDVYVADVPSQVTAILGSCMAVCLWEPRLRIGGVSHFMMPKATPGPSSSLRFGDVAIPALLSALERLGAKRQGLHARLFGGASVNGEVAPEVGASLGQQNIDVARDLLAKSWIPVLAEDVGGTAGRKLSFQTHDGKAVIKGLGSG